MFKFCIVTDRKLLGLQWQRKMIDVIRDAIDVGVDAVQIREKELSSKELLKLAKKLRRITEKKAMLIINDRIDIAILSGADGVHLGMNSISLPEVRKLIGASHKFIVGVSCHSVSDVLKAEKNKANYVFLGPIYWTSSKEKYGKPLGINLAREARQKTKIKIIAIGGINEKNAKECINAGADGVAVISTIFKSNNPEESAEKIFEIIR